LVQDCFLHFVNSLLAAQAVAHTPTINTAVQARDDLADVEFAFFSWLFNQAE